MSMTICDSMNPVLRFRAPSRALRFATIRIDSKTYTSMSSETCSMNTQKWQPGVEDIKGYDLDQSSM